MCNLWKIILHWHPWFFLTVISPNYEKNFMLSLHSLDIKLKAHLTFNAKGCHVDFCFNTKLTSSVNAPLLEETIGQSQRKVLL
jgi:hypothetical protein